MTRVGAASYGCLALGLFFGAASDAHPERPVVERGGWRVLQADFHMHSRYSDGFLSPPELVMQASRRGLDVIAVTEHNMLFPARLARWWSELTGGPTVLLGEEVTTRDWHLHAIGIDERVSPMQTLREAIADIHRQGGLAIAAHPVRRFWKAFVPVITELDGAELMHPIAMRPNQSSRGDWSGAHLAEFFALAEARGKRLTAIGSSDYHFGSALGRPRTFVLAKSAATVDVMDALRAGRTVVRVADGTLRGDPAAVALLEADPVMAVDADYGNALTGWADVLGRALGLLGLAGLLVFRR